MAIRRLFVVGASRSGTTVVQRALSERYALYTLPETAFFMEDLASRKRRLSALSRLHNGMVAHKTEQHSQWIGLAMRLITWPRFAFNSGVGNIAGAVWQSPERTAEIFVHHLDRLASASGSNGWLEKTPLHCMHIPLIRNLVRPDGFVFVLREGRDTAASIRDRALRYPDLFGWQHSAQRCVNVWNSTIHAATQELGSNDIYFVGYERFATDPEVALRHVADRFSLSRREAGGVRAHTFKAEAWKAGVSQDIRPQASKWKTVFSDDEQRFVSERLDLVGYREILGAIERGEAQGIA